MSDAQDYLDNVYYAPPTEIWDPAKGQNVYTNGNNAQYIQSNPQTYSNYGGAVTSRGGQSITSDAFVPHSAKPRAISGPGAPNGFDPNELRVANERMALNPYDPYNRYSAEQQSMNFVNNVRRIPGGNPGYGVMPGTDIYYDLLGQSETDPSKLDQATLRFGRLTQRSPGSIPTLAQSSDPQRGIGISGRGYHLPGVDMNSINWNQNPMELARQFQSRWRANEPSQMQQIARKYYAPFVASMAGAGLGGVGGVGAAALGAGWGALSQGAMTGWKNPAAIGLGAVGGFAGGWGGNALGNSLGWGPVATGALTGAGNAAGSGIARGAVTGDWQNLPRDIAIGAGSGAVGSLAGGGLPGKAAGSVAGAGLGTLWPGYAKAPRRPTNPYNDKDKEKKQ